MNEDAVSEVFVEVTTGFFDGILEFISKIGELVTDLKND